jgi:hypothetical protein
MLALQDHRRAGYGWLRLTELGLFLRVDGRKDIDLIEALIAPRTALGFNLVYSFMTLPRPKIDWDYFVQKTAEYGLKTEFPIDRYSADLAYPMVDYEWMEDTLSFLSGRLAGRVNYFEYGNEYDRIIFPGARFDSGKREFDWWGTPEEYATDLAHFRTGIKRGNPQARILNAGVTCGLWTPGRETFVPRMLDGGAKSTIDVFAVHGYGGYDNVQRVRRDLTNRGLHIPWANTERGIGSQDLGAHRLALEEILQSKRDGALFYTSFFPERFDYLGNPATGKHGPYKQALSEFATLLADGAPGLKFAMESNLAHLLSHAKDIMNRSSGGVLRWQWQSDAGYVYAVASDNPGLSETFLSGSPITRIDLYGNAVAQAQSPLAIELPKIPVYLVSQQVIRSALDTPPLMVSGPRLFASNESVTTRQIEYFLDEKVSQVLLKSGSLGADAGPLPNTAARFAFPNTPSAFAHSFKLQGDGKSTETLLSWASAHSVTKEAIDWSSVPVYEINQAAQVLTGRVLWQGFSDPNIYKGTVFGSTNLSAHLAFAKQGKALHFRAIISDDQLCGGDELALRWIEPTAMGSCRIAPKAEQPIIANTILGLQVVVQRQSSGWVCSGSFPSGSLFVDGQVPRFECVLRDADSHADAGLKPYLEMQAGAGEGVYLWP